MKVVIHKISALVLLLASVIPIALVFFFHIKQQAARHEMKERIEEQNLHSITLSKEKVHWVKKNKEILVNGKMFDVKSFYIENGNYKFIGLYDDEETELAEQLENNFNKTNENGSWLISTLFQWLQSVYPNDNEGMLLTLLQVQFNSPFIYINLHSPYRTILTPPPQDC